MVRHDDRDKRFVEQMQSEYEIGKNFNHPNLRRIHEMQIVKDFFFCASRRRSW